MQAEAVSKAEDAVGLQTRFGASSAKLFAQALPGAAGVRMLCISTRGLLARASLPSVAFARGRPGSGLVDAAPRHRRCTLALSLPWRRSGAARFPSIGLVSTARLR